LAASAAGFALVAWGGDRLWVPLLEQVNDGARAIRWAVRQPGANWWWLGGGGFATLLTIWVVIRAARS
jgi:hypothetical protein